MKRRLILLFIALSVLTAGCAAQSVSSTSSESISVYRVQSADSRQDSGLIKAEPLVLDTDENSVLQAAEALSETPANAKLQCPLPDGVKLLSAEQKDSSVTVYANSDYLDVSGIDKTIMDACITLTMCAVEGVDSVSICVGSDVIEKDLTEENYLLFDNILSSGKAQVRIYFPRASAKSLGSEYRTVSFDDDNSAEREILDALFEGPQSDDLERVFPLGTIVMSVYTLDGVCSVSLSGINPDDESMTPDETRLAVYAVVDSLTSLSSIKSVQILIDGKQVQYLWGFDISRPLTKSKSIQGSSAAG